MSMTIYCRTAAVALIAAAFAGAQAFADDGEEEKKPAEAADSAEEAPAEGKAAPRQQEAFYSMVRCLSADGVEVLAPRTEGWVPAEEGHYYPLGTEVRANAGNGVASGDEKAKGVFALGLDATVAVCAGGGFRVMPGADENAVPSNRVVRLVTGRVMLNLPRTMADGLVGVQVPSFSCMNLAGESTFAFQPVAEGNEVVVRCVTGSLALEGRHFSIARMGAANQVRIRTTGDELFTSIRGESGICEMMLDQGMGVEKNFETGETKDVPKSLKFSLSPLCAVKIFRAVSGVGGRMAVSVMTFDPTGAMKNRCAFAEGLSNVNSGELVVAEAVAESKETKQKDAEAEDTVEAEDDDSGKKKAAEKPAEKEEDAGDDAKEEKKDAKKDKEEDSDI